jgi:hypothetical protein
LDVSPDGKHIATGAYNRSGHVLDLNATSNTAIVTKFDQAYGTPVGALQIYSKNKRLISSGVIGTASSTKPADLRKRVTLGCWKPPSQRDVPGSQSLALVFRNCIYLYQS